MKIGKAEIVGGPNPNFWAFTVLVCLAGIKPLIAWAAFCAIVFVGVVVWLNMRQDAPVV